MVHKFVKMTFSLGLAMWFLMTGAMPALHACTYQCCMQPPTKTLEHVGVRAAPEPMECCCGTQTIPCDISRNRHSQVKDIACSTLPRTDNPVHPNPVATTSVESEPETFQGFAVTAGGSCKSPPSPLYLINVSLLC